MPPKGKKGAPKTSCSKTLAGLLKATLTKKITPQQLEGYIGREFDIPGSFWGLTSSKIDKEMPDGDVLYPVKVVEVNLGRKVTGIKELQPMVRIEWVLEEHNRLCKKDMWVGIAYFSEYITADDQRREEEKARLQAEQPVQESESFADAEFVVRTEDDEESSMEDKRRSEKAYSYFGTPVYVRDANQKVSGKKVPGKGSTEWLDKHSIVRRTVKVQLAVWQYPCNICGKKYIQWGTGNGALVGHIRSTSASCTLRLHEAAHRDICSSSKHTKEQVRGDDGALVQVYSFDEDFLHKQNFCRQCWLDFTPPSRARCPGTGAYVQGLDPRHTPPGAITTKRIVGNIKVKVQEAGTVLLILETMLGGGTFCSDTRRTPFPLLVAAGLQWKGEKGQATAMKAV